MEGKARSIVTTADTLFALDNLERKERICYYWKVLMVVVEVVVMDRVKLK